LVGYSDSNFAVFKTDKKVTTRTCHLLGSSLISWHNKKQVSVTLLIIETEYIDVGSCCAYILWLKQQLNDYGSKLSKIPLMCDNTSVINLTKNYV